MVAADIVKWVSLGQCTVRRLHGFNAQVADLYIQLHDAPRPTEYNHLLETGTVPAVKSFLAQANYAFDYEFPAGISLKELTVAISSNEPNFVAAGAGIDLTIDIDTLTLANQTVISLSSSPYSVIGDLNNGRTSIPVWLASANNDRLIRRIQFKNNSGVARWLALRFADTAADGEKSDLMWGGENGVANGAELDLWFSPGAASRLRSINPSGVHQGIAIAQSLQNPKNGIIQDDLDSSAFFRVTYEHLS
ncbi:MAG TPA: hypothetical protein VIY48_00225 [Candidatus Paceibacterota bacterium]